MESVLNVVLTILPPLVFWGAFVFAAGRYLAPRFPFLARSFLSRFPYRTIAAALVLFRVLYATLLTLGQYVVWLGDALGRHFLSLPVDLTLPLPLARAFPAFFKSSFGYFFFYSWGRFWLGVILSLALSLLFYWFLTALKRTNERFFEESEPTLGLACALIAGWPNALVFLVLAFALVVILSLARRVLRGERYTTLGTSFLIAVFLTLLAGDALAAALGIAILRL